MIAPLLALALAQAVAPAAGEPRDEARADAPVAASPGDGAPAATADRSPPPAPASRTVRVVPLPGGGFEAFLGDERVEGAAFYRAVARFDLAEAFEAAEGRRRTLYVAAGAALVAGPALGAIAAASQGRVPPDCTPVVTVDPTCARTRAQVIAGNEALARRTVGIGAAAGLAVGSVLALWGASVELPGPTAEEALELARRHAERQARPPGASLLLAPLAGGALLAVELRW